MVLMEWAGASSVATAAGLVDVRLGLVAVGLYLMWFANRGFDEGDDDGADDDVQ